VTGCSQCRISAGASAADVEALYALVVAMRAALVATGMMS
jgi:hypothetical protein